jgi:hypothetical protein
VKTSRASRSRPTTFSNRTRSNNSWKMACHPPSEQKLVSNIFRTSVLLACTTLVLVAIRQTPLTALPSSHRVGALFTRILSFAFDDKVDATAFANMSTDERPLRENERRNTRISSVLRLALCVGKRKKYWLTHNQIDLANQFFHFFNVCQIIHNKVQIYNRPT